MEIENTCFLGKLNLSKIDWSLNVHYKKRNLIQVLK